MKECRRCAEEKDFSEFGVRKKSSDGLAAYCRPCVKIINAESYQRTRGYQNPKRHASLMARLERNRAFVLAHLGANPCVDCGERDIIVLQYDHQGDKVANVSYMIRSSSLEAIKSEVAKCQVVCANCHTRRTATTFGWWRLDSV